VPVAGLRAEPHQNLVCSASEPQRGQRGGGPSGRARRERAAFDIRAPPLAGAGAAGAEAIEARPPLAPQSCSVGWLSETCTKPARFIHHTTYALHAWPADHGLISTPTCPILCTRTLGHAPSDRHKAA
jgi:hypothetical protein